MLLASSSNGIFTHKKKSPICCQSGFNLGSDLYLFKYGNSYLHTICTLVEQCTLQVEAVGPQKSWGLRKQGLLKANDNADSSGGDTTDGEGESVRHVKCTVPIPCLYGDTVRLLPHIQRDIFEYLL